MKVENNLDTDEVREWFEAGISSMLAQLICECAVQHSGPDVHWKYRGIRHWPWPGGICGPVVTLYPPLPAGFGWAGALMSIRLGQKNERPPPDGGKLFCAFNRDGGCHHDHYLPVQETAAGIFGASPSIFPMPTST